MARLGVVFSSGFFGFFAHAGFLSALRETGAAPDGYAGASSGAIVAAMAASGMGDQTIKKILFSLKKSDFWDPDPLPRLLRGAFRGFRGYTGYLRGEGFARLLEELPVKHIEDCPLPLVIVATNLTLRREEAFTRGSLIKAVQASGAVPMLFKPVEIEGSMYVDGGVVDKAPLLAMAEKIRPEKIIVHFVPSGGMARGGEDFLRRPMTPYHIQHLAINIGRQEDYERQRETLRKRGIEVQEVVTDAPPVGPNSLEKGSAAYQSAREKTLEILEGEGSL